MPGPTSQSRPFGALLTAIVSPFTADGALDVAGAQELATHLVDRHGHDGLVVNGTTGESATKTDAEDLAMLTAVLEAVGDRATVVAGVGTYDIPKRTGTAIETDTLVRIAEHPRIVANKDAKGDLDSTQWGMARTGLAWYCGDDILNLPMLTLGAAGMVSVVGHVVGDRLKAMAQALWSGDVTQAAAINASLLPVYTGMFRTQGVILTKAALSMQGLPGGPVRLPLIDATEEQRAQLRRDLAAGGVTGFTS